MIIVTGLIETEEKTALFVGSADQPEQNFYLVGVQSWNLSRGAEDAGLSHHRGHQ